MNRFGGLLAVALLIGPGCANGGDTRDLSDLSDLTVAPASSTRQDDVADGEGGFARRAGEFVNTCAVLTEAEVSAVTGLAVIGSEQTPGFGCTWFVEPVDPSIISDDAITWTPYPTVQFRAQLETADGGIDGEPIGGLGNEAVYVGSATLGSVWVLLDELAFEVGNQFAFTNVDGRPYQEALASAIAEALDGQG